MLNAVLLLVYIGPNDVNDVHIAFEPKICGIEIEICLGPLLNLSLSLD
jgi:hypothetical protein